LVGVNSYRLMDDLTRPGAPPFVSLDLYGALGNDNGTDLLLAEPFSLDTDDANLFLSSIDITSSGNSQKSFTQVFAGTAYPDPALGGTYSVYTSRRGSMRINAAAPSYNMRGGIATMPGPDGSHFFGTNAENFVLGHVTGPGREDMYTDSKANTLNSGFTGDALDGYVGDGVFGTQHVAGLTLSVPYDNLNRTDRSVRGFMVGRVEPQSELYQNSFSVLSGTGGSNSIQNAPTNFAMNIDATLSRLDAQTTVTDVFDGNGIVNSYTLAFGDPAGPQFGGSAFIDDNTFGALHTNTDGTSRIGTDAGADLAHGSQAPGSYLVSGRAAPVVGYEHCTQCNFIDWGWWGTRFQIENDGTLAGPGADARRDYVHMGTWVAGDITANADLPNSTVATYNGTAMGTAFDKANLTQFIAKGDFDMNIDFGTRTGTATISNFAGLNATGGITAPNTGTDALFAGSIAGAGTTGQVSGAFVNGNGNIAEGVIGQFVLDSGTNGINATGTFAASK